ncbi:hypothetical protein FHU38_004647 [Saccharomonospora amisosensis]|uniref:Uncharacterized protein n=1 Tax=Saccharomonospora amisosensis TaxID=1128677 RepID=A0A7X5ZSV4_9PSEU|nr:hypothetical protein [Saccharomonospora amisosensis]NIJ14303.1 hypothetical protein [Saccharomonospora amisosensis]
MTEQESRVVNGQSTRTDRVVSWIGWHIGELVAVGVPLLLAATVTVWLATLSLLAGTAWAIHETRQARAQRAIRAEAEQRRLQAADQGSVKEQADPAGTSGAGGKGASA